MYEDICCLRYDDSDSDADSDLVVLMPLGVVMMMDDDAGDGARATPTDAVSKDYIVRFHRGLSVDLVLGYKSERSNPNVLVPWFAAYTVGVSEMGWRSLMHRARTNGRDGVG